jgi:hypothetical protein
VTRTGALAVLLALAAGPATAGEAVCWFENNVVVVGAELAGVPGDYILDTATPQTVLAETQAQTAGYAETTLSGEVRVAGLWLKAPKIAVADIDLRTGALPTPIAGVIGADVLRGRIVDVSFRPCRVAIWRPGHAPRFRRGARLPLAWTAGRPTVTAAAADGPHALRGAFAIGIGADTAVRLSDALAAAPGAARPKELYPYGILRPRLDAFSFAGAMWRDLPSGLTPAEGPALAGQIGTPILAPWRLRLDLAHDQLLLARANAGEGAKPQAINRGNRKVRGGVTTASASLRPPRSLRFKKKGPTSPPGPSEDRVAAPSAPRPSRSSGSSRRAGP